MVSQGLKLSSSGFATTGARFHSRDGQRPLDASEDFQEARLKRNDFEVAKKQLARCRKIVSEMERCRSAQEMPALWSDYLVGSQRVFSKLAAAATGRKSAPWYGNIKNQRKSDELLQYVHQARHADEHGLENIAEPSAGGIAFGAADRRRPFKMALFRIGMPGEITIVGPENVGVAFKPANAILFPVTNEGRTYEPPRTHLGRPWVENNALAVAGAVLIFMDKIIAEGEAYIAD